MSVIQTESPYFQPIPKAPQPFSTGLFPNYPSFTSCDEDSRTCAVSRALRILDSSSVYIMGAGRSHSFGSFIFYHFLEPSSYRLLEGLYGLFSGYFQKCLDTGDCQQRAVEVSQSTDTWIYNLVTKGMIEMLSPVNKTPSFGADNVNGLMSTTILSWVRERNVTIGGRKFPDFQLHESECLDALYLTDACTTALTQNILCYPWLKTKPTPGNV